MSFAARSAQQTLRAAARRAPRATTSLAANQARSAAYSLLAGRSAVAAKTPRVAATQVWPLHLSISHEDANRLYQTRGVKTLDFAGTEEVVYERSDWPLAKLQDYFKNDTLALIGYGSQGHGQGLNARDNGMNVIVGVRKDGTSWKEAVADGWVRVFVLGEWK
jgi:ketol-acid reductoisomerase